MKGFPDTTAHRDNVTAYIEDKGEGDRRRPSQIKWHDEIKPHLGPNIVYIIAESVDDYEKIANYRVRKE